MPLPHAIVMGGQPGDHRRVGRSARALAAAGLRTSLAMDGGALATALGAALEGIHAERERVVGSWGSPRRAAEGGVWIVRAGAWPASCAPFEMPPRSATGLPLAALGAVRAPPGEAPSSDALAWSAALAASGGDFARPPLPKIASVFVEGALAHRLARRVAGGEDLGSALGAEVTAGAARAVRFPPLDVLDDARVRVAEVVTSFQRGGAERVVLHLCEELPRRGVRTRAFAIGGPAHEELPRPPGALDIHLASLPAALIAFGADLVHAHLLDRAALRFLASAGFPPLVTVHNEGPGWPAGLHDLEPGEAALLVACSRAVEDDLRRAALPVPARTVWNGVPFGRLRPGPALAASGREWRRRLDLGDDAFILFALANARAQKRLERLPSILAATRDELRRRGITRDAVLVLAGSPSSSRDEGARVEEELDREVARLALGPHVRRVGAVAEPAGLLAAAGALVSTSAYEGLSLALLEAVATGSPAVVTAAGGAAEVAAGNPAVTVLPREAPPERFAMALADLSVVRPSGGREAAEVHFTSARMAEGYARLFPRAIEAAATPSELVPAPGGRGPTSPAGAERLDVNRGRRGQGLLLVTNNLSTGGAQSSARRLLVGLRAEGVRVRAAVLDEEPAAPTPGRRALVAAGIEVLALPPSRALDPADAVERLLEWTLADRPEAVLLWNAIPAYKVLIADLLLEVPLFDVSPGAMYFVSLERYFARPRPGLAYRDARDYGVRLRGAIVKYEAEASRAAEVLGAPVHVVPNGVPVGALSRRCGDPARLVIGTAARIAPAKRLEQAIEVLRRASLRLPPHVLKIAGGVERGASAYAAGLKERAEGLAVEWMGELEDTGPFLRGLDIFAQVSEPPGCPNASLEAMAEGLPVIATDVGGAREQIVEGVTGRLVPAGDPDAFAEALVALARDAELRERMGGAGRARAIERFSVERMVADYARICLGREPSLPGLPRRERASEAPSSHT